MRAFRIGSSAYPLMDGSGAASTDTARWNSRGRFVIYAAEHYSTALREKAAQVNSVRLPRSLLYTRIDIPPDASREEVAPDDLPGWAADDRLQSQRHGDRWYDERRSLVLIVPSLVAPGLERNILINQHHPQFSQLAASPAAAIRCHPRLLV